MLHHHQGVARIAQAVHGLDDALHIFRVQPNAGLVQHKQGVDQRSSQRRSEVDALHLATRKGAALPVEREVTNAHVIEVAQAGGDFFHQQLERLLFGGVHWGAALQLALSLRLGLQLLEKVVQLFQRHLHQVVQAQAGQSLQLGAIPSHPRGHKTLRRVQHRLRLL